MKKRMIALFLVLTMTISMISCGITKKEEDKANKTADISSFLNKVEDLQQKNLDFTMDVDLSGEEINQTGQETIKASIKGSSFMQEDKKGQVELSYKFGDSNEYKQLTTIIIDERAAYIDFATLKTAAVDICNVLNISEGAAMISILPRAQYMKIDEATISELLKEFGDVDVTIPSVDEEKQKESKKVIRAAIEYVVKTIQDAVKEVNPAPISGSDSEFDFSMTKENLSAVCDAVLALDLGAKYDEMVQKMKEAGNADEYTKKLEEEKGNTIASIKETLNKLKAEKDNFTTFDLSGNFAVNGEKGARKVTNKVLCNVQDETNKMAVTIDATVGEEAPKDKTVTIPTDATDFKVYMEQLSAMFQF